MCAAFISDLPAVGSDGYDGVYQVLESHPQYTRIKIIIPEIQISPLEHNGTIYQRILLSGFGGTREVGKPEVPQSIQLVGISSTGSFEIKLLSTVEEELPVDLLYPAQPSPKRLPDGTTEQLPFAIDQDFYRIDTWYPAQPATAQEAAILREYRVLPVAICPVQYNPARRIIKIIKEMEIEVYQISPYGVNEKSDHVLYESSRYRNIYDSFI